MRIPSFIPLIESERRKRGVLGLILEIVIWVYLSVVLRESLRGPW